MKRIPIVLAALILALLVVPSASADNGTWSMPYTGGCTASTCVSVDNSGSGSSVTAVGGHSADGTGVKGTSVTYHGVLGSSGATFSSGAGVYGSTTTGTQGVGIEGVAPSGSTAVWANNTGGGDNTAIWADGRVYVNGADFVAYTAGKGIILRNGTLCQRVTLHSGGGSLDFTNVTCP